MNYGEKKFLLPGMVVELKQDLLYKPKMVVKKKDTRMIKKETGEEKDDEYFKGMICFWFTDSGLYQEETFSTKDLIIL